MLVIGIAGGSGSGKTTVVKAITRQLQGRVVVIPQDSYYKDSSHVPVEERKNINFDHPDAIDWKLMCQQIRELKQGHTIQQPVYSYITCSRSTTETVTVEPADVIIVEGILIFTCKELRDQLNIKSSWTPTTMTACSASSSVTWPSAAVPSTPPSSTTPTR
jgi:Uridine kinase